MTRADDEIAWRSCGGCFCTPVCLAALTSNAAAPAVCGDAIDVPCSIEYPGGSSYVPATGPPGCHIGVVEIAAPGATTVGLKPPASVGPRELNGCRLSSA